MPILLFNFAQYNLLLNTIIYLIAILTFILLVVLLIEKKIKKQIRQHLSTHGVIFMRTLRAIESIKSPYQKVVLISHLSKQVFKELFKLNFFPTFEETKKLARGKNFYEIEQFCNRMTELIYAGKKPGEEEGFEILSRMNLILKKYMLIKEFPDITRHIEKVKAEQKPIIQKQKIIKQQPLEIQQITKPVESRIIIKKAEIPKRVEIPAKIEKGPIIDENEKKFRMILASIEEGRRKLQERDTKAAYQYYNAARILYKQLDKEKKAACTSKLLEFYKEILASFMK